MNFQSRVGATSSRCMPGSTRNRKHAKVKAVCSGLLCWYWICSIYHKHTEISWEINRQETTPRRKMVLEILGQTMAMLPSWNKLSRWYVRCQTHLTAVISSHQAVFMSQKKKTRGHEIGRFVLDNNSRYCINTCLTLSLLRFSLMSHSDL